MIRLNTTPPIDLPWPPPTNKVAGAPENITWHLLKDVDGTFAEMRKTAGELLDEAHKVQHLLEGAKAELARERKGRLTAERMVRWMGRWIVFQAVLLLAAAWGWWTR